MNTAHTTAAGDFAGTLPLRDIRSTTNNGKKVSHSTSGRSNGFASDHLRRHIDKIKTEGRLAPEKQKLACPDAQRDQILFHRDAVGYFDSQKSFERLQISGLRNAQTMQQLR